MPTSVSGLIDIIRLKVDHSGLSDAQVLDIINNAQRRIQRTSPLFFNEDRTDTVVTTAASSLQTFVQPTGMNRPFAVFHLQSGYYLPVAYRDDFFSLIADYNGATAASSPTWWTLYRDNGYLFPVLSSTITLVQFFDSQTADTTDQTSAGSRLFNRAPEVLEYESVAEYYDTLGEEKRAAVWRRKSAQALNDLFKQQQQYKVHAHDPVPKTPGTIWKG